MDFHWSPTEPAGNKIVYLIKLLVAVCLVLMTVIKIIFCLWRVSLSVFVRVPKFLRQPMKIDRLKIVPCWSKLCFSVCKNRFLAKVLWKQQNYRAIVKDKLLCSPWKGSDVWLVKTLRFTCVRFCCFGQGETLPPTPSELITWWSSGSTLISVLVPRWGAGEARWHWSCFEVNTNWLKLAEWMRVLETPTPTQHLRLRSC